MKKTLVEAVRSVDTLGRAWSAIRKNAKGSKSQETRDEAEAFEQDAFKELSRIQRQLALDKFTFRPVKGKKIPKKKKGAFRPLVIAPLESRIVQRAIHEVLMKVANLQPFLKTPYSFGGIRKEHKQDLASVPAAIECVLKTIGDGSTYVVRSDISDFFTKIPKSAVTDIVASAVKEPAFVKLFKAAIEIELENMAQLRTHANAFPIEDIGVAQGNSLSPLMGNIYLADFDRELNNSSDVRCIRYIDDFVIMAPSRSTANNYFEKAKSILKSKGLSISESKTIRSDSQKGFTFLGIEIINGLIRPSEEARNDLIRSLAETLKSSENAIQAQVKTKDIEARFNLINTLLRTRSVIQGWGKHYWFCNDFNCFKAMDKSVDRLLENYRQTYANARQKLDDANRRTVLGLGGLSQLDQSRHFSWPTNKPAVSIPASRT